MFYAWNCTSTVHAPHKPVKIQRLTKRALLRRAGEDVSYVAAFAPMGERDAIRTNALRGRQRQSLFELEPMESRVARMKIYEFKQDVLFKHCDPAGIVFYPRYFEMFNDCVESFFGSIGHPFPEILKAGGVPTVDIKTQFRASNRHGDCLVIRLTLTSLGNTSLGVNLRGLDGDRLCFNADLVLVRVGENMRPLAWSDDERAGFAPYLVE